MHRRYFETIIERHEVRFEVLVNSQRLCIAGISSTDQGVLNADLSLVTKTPNGDKCEMLVHSSQMAAGCLTFAMKSIEVGDEITIRALSDGEFDTGQPTYYLDPDLAVSLEQVAREQLSDFNEAEEKFANAERACPRCATKFVSIGNHGQCPSCGFIFLASHPEGDQPW